jgi:hypothetical protein
MPLAEFVEHQPKKPAKSIRDDICYVRYSDREDKLNHLDSKAKKEHKSEPSPKVSSFEIDTQKQAERNKNDKIVDHLSQMIA